MKKGYYLVSYKYSGSSLFDGGGYGYNSFTLNEDMPPEQFIREFIGKLNEGTVVIIAVSKLA